MNQSSESEDSFKKKAHQITHETSKQVLQDYRYNIKNLNSFYHINTISMK